MPTIDLTADELAAVAAAIRRAIDEDRFPHAPRLDPLRLALAKLDPATAAKPASGRILRLPGDLGPQHSSTSTGHLLRQRDVDLVVEK